MIILFRKRTGAKLSLVLLSIFLFLLLFAPSASAAMMGDIDDSGSINVLDVVLAKQHVLGLQLLTPAQKLVADVNGSGDVDVLDVDLIMRKTLGLITEFPFVQLQVSSVTAVNARQVEIVFNKAVSKSLAENPANYEVYKQGAMFTNVFTTVTNGAVAALQEDGRTVLLTLNTTPIKQVFVNGSNFNRIIVKAAVGLAADYTNSSVAFLDTTAPTFISARSVGSSTIELTFSEPVKTINGVDLTGVTLSDGINPSIGLNLAGATFSDAQRKVTINLTSGNLTPGATYTVSLLPAPDPQHNLEDYVNIKALPASRQFTHIPVTTTLSVTAAAINEKTVRLTFNRAVSLTQAGANVRFRLNFNVDGAVERTSANMDGFTKSFAAAAVTGSGNTQYDIQFTNPMPYGSNTLYVHYIINLNASGRIVDTFGNVLPNDTSVDFTVSASTTPVMVSAYTVDSDSIALVYSRNVTNNGIEPGQYEYEGISGIEIVSDDNNVIVVRFYDPIGTGTFLTGTALPTDRVTYEESVISSRRTKDQAIVANDALSRDQIIGIVAGF
jgi:hypothetical protein